MHLLHRPCRPRGAKGGTAMSELGDYEPFSREGAVIAAIAAAFAGADSAPLNDARATACGGVALSDRFSNRLAVKDAMHALTLRQHLILWYRFAKDETKTATAAHYHISRNTVACDEVLGLQTLVRVLWGEPRYVSPPRVYGNRPAGT